MSTTTNTTSATADDYTRWNFMISRQHIDQVGAALVHRFEPVTEVFSTEEEALRAAESIQDRDGLALHRILVR